MLILLDAVPPLVLLGLLVCKSRTGTTLFEDTFFLLCCFYLDFYFSFDMYRRVWLLL